MHFYRIPADKTILSRSLAVECWSHQSQRNHHREPEPILTFFHLLHFISDCCCQFVFKIPSKLLLCLLLSCFHLGSIRILYTLHTFDFWDVVLHHLFYTLFQCYTAACTLLASSSQLSITDLPYLHLHFHNTRSIVKTLEKDVTSIRFNTWTNTSTQKLLNQLDNFTVCLLNIVRILWNVFRTKNDRLGFLRRKEVS